MLQFIELFWTLFLYKLITILLLIYQTNLIQISAYAKSYKGLYVLKNVLQMK